MGDCFEAVLYAEDCAVRTTQPRLAVLAKSEELRVCRPADARARGIVLWV
jgi:hypothetical protein